MMIDIKSKIGTHGGTFYTNFRGLNVPEHGTESESFTVISIYSSIVYEENITCKYIYLIVLLKLHRNKWQMIFMKIFLKLIQISSFKCCITIELI